MVEDGKKWEADAGNISNYMNFDRFVYRNGAVNSFLNDAGKFFIIAAKGMGKTLLLSYKRYLLWQKYSVNGDNTSVIFIPSQNPYISFIENIGTTLSQEHIKKFEDWEYCQKVWATVIELSVLSYAEIDVELFLGSLPPRASRHTGWLKSILSEPRTVDFVFNELISMSESSITQFIRDTSNAVNFAFRNVNRAVFMFFDRFDNALEVAHDSIWQPIQAGLLEAAWNVMRSNSHIKMYLSIRQEAYAAHHSRNSYAISSSVVKIEYSREELKQLVNQLVQYYENKDTLEAFLGFDYFHNTIVFADEKVYDFMFRYSIGRPRDFVVLCDELSKASDTLYANDEEKRLKLKERVRDIASNAIIQSLFDELRMLLCCLTTLDRFNNFLTLLKCNILSYSEMKTICCKYNESQCQGDCSICSDEHHPFCDLYNMGLLGIVSSDAGSRFQQFKTPYANLIHGLRDDNDYFLIHPALREYINNLHRSTKRGRSYTLFKGILIGNGLPWIDVYDDLYRVNGWISQIKNDETRHFFEATLEESIKLKDWKLDVEKYNAVRANSYPIYEQRIIDAIVTYLEAKKICEPQPISIFVSYAYDSNAHKEKVESFVNMLRGDMGFNAQMDSSLKNQYPDIDEMMTVGLKMDKIIVVLSEGYKQRADGRSGGVWKEFKMIADDLEQHPQKYIFVSFEKYTNVLKERVTPIRIGNRWIVDLEEGRRDHFNELISFIKDEKEYPFKDVITKPVSVKEKIIAPF